MVHFIDKLLFPRYTELITSSEASTMIYRPLGRTGLSVSAIGLGCEHLQGKSPELIESVVLAAIDAGINIFDVFMSEPNVRSHIGAALAKRPDTHVILQGHIGSVWKNGQYGRGRSLDDCRFFFEDFLTRLGQPSIDIGMIHYVDDDADLDEILSGPVYAYARELKERGVIRCIGMSSHNPLVALRAVPYIDVLMFSVNPAFDCMDDTTDFDGLFIPGTAPESRGHHGSARQALYRACEEAGVAITVMKPYGAGTLLKAERSPFGVALTPAQCLSYCLDRPAVATVLAGSQTVEEVAINVAAVEASGPERDYTAVLSGAACANTTGRCMYCNHCLPCPSEIDIAQVNKFLDMALTGGVTESLRDHYRLMSANGADCIGCGSCEANCPFQVPVIERMAKAEEIFA